MSSRAGQGASTHAALTFRLQHAVQTPSTNLDIKRAIAAGEPEGLVVHADVQTGGYGRQGRQWMSPEGGLYASFLLRPNIPAARISTIALAAGVAVVRALRTFAGEEGADRIGVKWPNDVLLDGRTPERGKLCGISAERVDGAVCLGIGINIRKQDDGMGTLPASSPAYLGDVAPRATVDDVLAAVMDELATAYPAWQQDGFAAVAEDYRRFHVLTGLAVQVVDRTGGKIASGIVQSVDESGCLIVRDADDAIHRVSSGEAHIIW